MRIYSQKQLLKYYNELNYNQKNNLKNQIKKINIKYMNKLYKKSYKDIKINIKKIEPLKILTKTSKYREYGLNLIKNGEYAVVIMAGGNGSRLCFNGPKGTLELNIKGRMISLFEIYINQLKEIIKNYNIIVPIYIMTSSQNNKETIDYFIKNNYFNYPSDSIKFFIQNNLPILDLNGKIILKDKYNILFGPNGNGDIFKSLKKYNYIKEMKNSNIKYLLFVNIDNILNKLVDFDFIGSIIKNNYKLGVKTIKLNNTKEWIFCKYKKRPFMLPSSYIDEVNIEKYKNISYYLIHIDLIEKFSKIKLPYHRAYKKSIYLNSINTLNSFKFEKFIFDAFKYAKNMLLYETDEHEFYPIKRFEDIKNAVELYEKNNH